VGTTSVASGPHPADRANFRLNLDIARPPSLNEGVPEIKIGKGTRCSTIELHQPRPVIGFEPIPAAYQVKYPHLRTRHGQEP
jgi:hypothetical protein